MEPVPRVAHGASVAAARLTVPVGAALSRPRLEQELGRVWQGRAGVVHGPAGCGKTTLLARFAQDASCPVAWYRAEPSASSRADLLHHLAAAFGHAGVLRTAGADWHDHAELLAALPTTGPHLLLVVDDLHLLDDDVARGVFEPVLDDAPGELRVLFGSRSAAGLNLSRLRLEGGLVEVGAEDLRFRAWETEQLYRQVYREVLPPEDLAELTRRTEGWAAGLQLFHLAARGKTARERHELVTSLDTRSRFVRDYLTHNVLRDLDEDVRDFLVESCVLPLLTGPLCDALLDRSDSAPRLEELERRQVFTALVDGASTYRYHDVLRRHLEQLLMARAGEAGLRRRFRRAAELLEAHGATAEALRAYARADDLDAASRLLSGRGVQIAAGAPLATATLVGALPPWLVEGDPWLLLADARRQLAEGACRAALERYQQAETAFGTGAAVAQCRRERAALLAWTEPGRGPGSPAGLSQLRAATRSHPVQAGQAVRGDTALDVLTRGVASLLAGGLADASRVLWAGSRDPGVSSGLGRGLELAARLADVLLTGPVPDGVLELADVQARVEALGVPALARASRVVTALATGPGVAQDRTVVGDCLRVGDEWGAALARLCEGLSGVLAGRPSSEPLQLAASSFADVDAAVLEAWAGGAAALALAAVQAPSARLAARHALRRARSSGCQPGRAFALAALALADGAAAGARMAQAEAVASTCGLAGSRLWTAVVHVVSERGAARRPAPGTVLTVLPPGSVPAARGSGRDPGRPHAPILVCCFGGLRLEVAQGPVDLGVVRPRARSTLRVLVLHTGTVVHREVLADALWRSATPAAAARGVQVAVSSLRGLLPAGAEVQRHDEGYLLQLPPGSHVDVVDFRLALAAADRAAALGHPEQAVLHLAAAQELYAGELFPEEGPAEWVVGERERLRALAVAACCRRADACMGLGRWMDAVTACETGLDLDQFCDPLWRTLRTAQEQAGNRAAAAVAAAGYRRSLGELGVLPH